MRMSKTPDDTSDPTCNRASESGTLPFVTARRYSVSEVCETVDIPPHLLRQWENRFKQLKPGRDRANHRYYSAKDVEIVRRIKYLIVHEGMTTDGVRRRLAQELRGEGRPRTNREVLEAIDRIETQIRDLLDLLDT